MDVSQRVNPLAKAAAVLMSNTAPFSACSGCLHSQKSLVITCPMPATVQILNMEEAAAAKFTKAAFDGSTHYAQVRGGPAGQPV